MWADSPAAAVAAPAFGAQAAGMAVAKVTLIIVATKPVEAVVHPTFALEVLP